MLLVAEQAIQFLGGGTGSSASKPPVKSETIKKIRFAMDMENAHGGGGALRQRSP